MIAALTGCDDDFARPPMVFPSTPDIETTADIREIKSQYWSIVEGTPQQIGLDANGDSIVIKGRICSSDETGNIYKNIIVQTVDADGQQWALTFAVNKTKMYETYKYGQEVYINLTGMYIGGYRGLMQLGTVGDQGMSFMDEALFTGRATTSGLPRLADVDTTATTIAALEAVKTDNNERMMWQSRLVRVENVEFEEPGETFAGSANTNRYIKDGATAPMPRSRTSACPAVRATSPASSATSAATGRYCSSTRPDAATSPAALPITPTIPTIPTIPPAPHR